MYYIHTIEHFSAIERNEVLTCATNWMSLKNVTPSLKRQIQRVIYCIYLYKISRIDNTDSVICIVVARALEEAGME